MSKQKLEKTLSLTLDELYSSGRSKGKEKIVVDVKKANQGRSLSGRSRTDSGQNWLLRYRGL